MQLRTCTILSHPAVREFMFALPICLKYRAGVLRPLFADHVRVRRAVARTHDFFQFLFLLFLLRGVGDLHQLRGTHLLPQRAGELGGVHAVPQDHHLVLGIASDLHRLDPARLGHQRHGLGPALVAGHRHLDHDLLLQNHNKLVEIHKFF
jgi:hypothetical protein